MLFLNVGISLGEGHNLFSGGRWRSINIYLQNFKRKFFIDWFIYIQNNTNQIKGLFN